MKYVNKIAPKGPTPMNFVLDQLNIILKTLIQVPHSYNLLFRRSCDKTIYIELYRKNKKKSIKWPLRVQPIWSLFGQTIHYTQNIDLNPLLIKVVV